jgi:hypothetical protein
MMEDNVFPYYPPDATQRRSAHKYVRWDAARERWVCHLPVSGRRLLVASSIHERDVVLQRDACRRFIAEETHPTGTPDPEPEPPYGASDYIDTKVRQRILQALRTAPPTRIVHKRNGPSYDADNSEWIVYVRIHYTSSHGTRASKRVEVYRTHDEDEARRVYQDALQYVRYREHALHIQVDPTAPSGPPVTLPMDVMGEINAAYHTYHHAAD